MTDVIIVGSGVVGLSIGIELARSGRGVSIYHSPEEEMYAASAAAGAMLGAFGEVTAGSPSTNVNRELSFRVESARLYESWLNQVESSNTDGLIKRGTVLIANSFGRSDRINLEAIEKALQQFDEPFDVLSERDVPNYQPSRGFECHRALFLPREGYLDVHALLAILKAEFQRFEHCELIPSRVSSVLINEHKELTGIQLDSGATMHSSCVVLAAGVNTSKLLAGTDLQASLPTLISGKGVGIELETNEHFPHVIRTPNRDFACGVHLVPRAESRVYVGATNRTASVPGTRPGVSVEEVHDILHEAVHEIHTGLESANIIKLHCGSRPLSTDSQALIGSTVVAGLYLATGTYRNGILMAPLIAQTLLKEIEGEPDERWNFMRPVAEERFKLFANKAELFREGAEGIVSFLPQPHGKLPYNRAQELTDALESLLQLSLYSDDELPQDMLLLREELRVLVTERPMVETFAQLFYRFHEYKAGIRESH